jgi:meromycolic acid (3R)-3-hydroxyacyl-[acyl-carrier protein] dehydratase HadAB
VSAGVLFEELSVGDEIPPLAREVRREDVNLYAEASGDHNPLHLDDGFARAAGFPGIIAHGMFTMGHLASTLSRWLGDAATIVRMRVAFRSSVAMGDTILAGGRVRALDAATRRVTFEVWVSVEHEGDTEYPIRRSEAEVLFV